jgi:transcriptional regulator with XRE-family HTH domain
MIGEELRQAREKAGLTQEHLSFRAELSRPNISQLEGNLKSPIVATLFRICDALEVSAADLVRQVDAARKRQPGGRQLRRTRVTAAIGPLPGSPLSHAGPWP